MNELELTVEEVDRLFAERGMRTRTMEEIVEDRLKVYQENPEVLRSILHPSPAEEWR